MRDEKGKFIVNGRRVKNLEMLKIFNENDRYDGNSQWNVDKNRQEGSLFMRTEAGERPLVETDLDRCQALRNVWFQEIYTPLIFSRQVTPINKLPRRGVVAEQNGVFTFTVTAYVVLAEENSLKLFQKIPKKEEYSTQALYESGRDNFIEKSLQNGEIFLSQATYTLNEKNIEKIECYNVAPRLVSWLCAYVEIPEEIDNRVKALDLFLKEIERYEVQTHSAERKADLADLKAAIQNGKNMYAALPGKVAWRDEIKTYDAEVNREVSQCIDKLTVHRARFRKLWDSIKAFILREPNISARKVESYYEKSCARFFNPGCKGDFHPEQQRKTIRIK